MQITRVGEGLAVVLTAELVEHLGLKEGDQVHVRAAGAGALEIEKVSDRLELLRRLRKYRGLLPADYKFNRDDCYPASRGGNDDGD